MAGCRGGVYRGKKGNERINKMCRIERRIEMGCGWTGEETEKGYEAKNA